MPCLFVVFLYHCFVSSIVCRGLGGLLPIRRSVTAYVPCVQENTALKGMDLGKTGIGPAGTGALAAALKVKECVCSTVSFRLAVDAIGLYI